MYQSTEDVDKFVGVCIWELQARSVGGNIYTNSTGSLSEVWR